MCLAVRQRSRLHHLQAAFRLAHEGHDCDDREVERSTALKKIMGWVRLHPYNIAQKVQIVVEHFRAQVAPLLNGCEKAMVVVGSRVAAVRWKLAIDRYITDHAIRSARWWRSPGR